MKCQRKYPFIFKRWTRSRLLSRKGVIHFNTYSLIPFIFPCQRRPGKAALNSRIRHFRCLVRYNPWLRPFPLSLTPRSLTLISVHKTVRNSDFHFNIFSPCTTFSFLDNKQTTAFDLMVFIMCWIEFIIWYLTIKGDIKPDLRLRLALYNLLTTSGLVMVFLSRRSV